MRVLHHLCVARAGGRLPRNPRCALLVLRRLLPEGEFPGRAGVARAWATTPVVRQLHVLTNAMALFVPGSAPAAALLELTTALVGEAAAPSAWLVSAAAAAHARGRARTARLLLDPQTRHLHQYEAEDDAAAFRVALEPRGAPLVMRPAVAGARETPAARFVAALRGGRPAAAYFAHHGTLVALHDALVTDVGAAPCRRLAQLVGGARRAAVMCDDAARAACAACHPRSRCPFEVAPARTPELLDELVAATVRAGLFVET